jgi:hypothetical protein
MPLLPPLDVQSHKASGHKKHNEKQQHLEGGGRDEWGPLCQSGFMVTWAVPHSVETGFFLSSDTSTFLLSLNTYLLGFIPGVEK